AALLQRNAAEYGSIAAVEAGLPITRTVEISHGSTKGQCTELEDKARKKTDCKLGPFHLANGLDDKGAWSLGLTGVLMQLEGDEASAIRFESWLARRRYLEEKTEDLSCMDGGGRATVAVRFDLHPLGDPALAFDLETGALLRATTTEADGAWA